MHRSARRLLGLVAGLLLFLIASALLYEAGMARLEGKPRTFWDSFEWAAETLSTTDYGADSPWRHPAMVVLVVVVQFAGVFLVFLIATRAKARGTNLAPRLARGNERGRFFVAAEAATTTRFGSARLCSGRLRGRAFRRASEPRARRERRARG